MADDPQAPDPFAVLAQQPVQMPQLQQPPAAQPQLATQPVKGHNAKAPGMYSLIKDMIQPPTQVQADPGGMASARPVSRLDTFESFLGNFLNSLGQGMAKQGQGPGSWGRGFGAAVQAPVVRQQQQQQLEQGQQQIQGEQTQNALAQQQLAYGPAQHQAQIAALTQQPRFSPQGQYLGNMNDSQYQQYLRGGQAAQVTAGAKMGVAQLNLAAAQGQVSRLVPDKDPQTGQMFYHAVNKFGKDVGQVDVNAIPSLMQKSSSTVEYKQQEDGSYVALPKTTTSGPVIPQPKGNPAGKYWATSSPNGIHAVPVMGTDGQPLMGKAPENIRTMAATATATLPHIDTVLGELNDLDKEGMLGEFKGKLTKGLANKGFVPHGATPEQAQKVGKFMNDVSLLDSAMLRTHFGARGGQQMYDKFTEMLNAGEDPNLMRGGLSSFKDYLNTYSNMDKGGKGNPDSGARRTIILR